MDYIRNIVESWELVHLFNVQWGTINRTNVKCIVDKDMFDENGDCLIYVWRDLYNNRFYQSLQDAMFPDNNYINGFHNIFYSLKEIELGGTINGFIVKLEKGYTAADRNSGLLPAEWYRIIVDDQEVIEFIKG